MSATKDLSDKTPSLRHRTGNTDQSMVPRALHSGYTQLPREDDENLDNITNPPLSNAPKKAKDSNIRLTDWYDDDNSENLMSKGRNNGKERIVETSIDNELATDVDRMPLFEEFGGKPDPPEETSCTIALQISLPFIIAGLGMVAAGLVLDKVQVLSISFQKILPYGCAVYNTYI